MLIWQNCFLSVSKSIHVWSTLSFLIRFIFFRIQFLLDPWKNLVESTKCLLFFFYKGNEMFGWSNWIIALTQQNSLLSKVFLIEPNILITFSKFQHPENSFFESKKHFFDIRWRKKFLDSKEIFALTVYQINVSLNWRTFFWFKQIFFGPKKCFFELKKFFLIQTNLLWSKEIDLFHTFYSVYSNSYFLTHFDKTPIS